MDTLQRNKRGVEDLSKMLPAEVRRVGSELQGFGNQVGREGPQTVSASNLVVQALGGTPLSASVEKLADGFQRLAESMNKYHDYLTAYGQSLISAAASYEHVDAHHGKAFASIENVIDQADTPLSQYRNTHAQRGGVQA